jgi:hypothetical protein
MNKTVVLLGVASCLAWLPGSIPLVNTPSWSSNSNDYSTGSGFWDIDTNGYVDFCMSNGNDMAYNYNAVYLNHEGTLEDSASWRSADSGAFGHLYLGDVDNDGLMDMAVAYLGHTTGDDRRPEIYRNAGGALGLLPYWHASDTTTHFDCCLGDVNLDGYLDLAIAAGDAYSGTAEPLKIYLNHAGVFDTLPDWQSANRVTVDAVRFADLDNDGRLDLVANGGNKLYVYYQVGDTLQRNPAWVDTISTAQVIGARLAIGDYDNDGWPDVACVCNGQMSSANNSIRVYHNDLGALDKPPLWILQRNDNYSSCVAWGDVNNDGFQDLAAGGWWEPVVVYENHNGILDTVPDWSWQPANPNNLVCENVLWGDVGNRYLIPTDESASGTGARKLFQLHHIPIQSFSGIDVTGVPVPRSGYSFDPLTGYVTLASAPPNGTDNVVFHYIYSAYPDLGLTNWEPSDHNYVFYNSTPPLGIGRGADPARARLAISSRFGSSDLRLSVSLPDHVTGTVAVFSVTGRLVATIAKGLGSGEHNLNWSSGNSLTKGVYFIRLSCSDGTVLSRKTIRIR